MSKFEVKCDRCGRDMEFALTPSNEVLLHPCTCICESCPVADRYERYAYTKWINIKDWIEDVKNEELVERAKYEYEKYLTGREKTVKEKLETLRERAKAMIRKQDNGIDLDVGEVITFYDLAMECLSVVAIPYIRKNLPKMIRVIRKFHRDKHPWVNDRVIPDSEQEKYKMIYVRIILDGLGLTNNYVCPVWFFGCIKLNRQAIKKYTLGTMEFPQDFKRVKDLCESNGYPADINTACVTCNENSDNDYCMLYKAKFKNYFRELSKILLERYWYNTDMEEIMKYINRFLPRSKSEKAVEYIRDMMGSYINGKWR